MNAIFAKIWQFIKKKKMLGQIYKLKTTIALSK